MGSYPTVRVPAAVITLGRWCHPPDIKRRTNFIFYHSIWLDAIRTQFERSIKQRRGNFLLLLLLPEAHARWRVQCHKVSLLFISTYLIIWFPSHFKFNLKWSKIKYFPINILTPADLFSGTLVSSGMALCFEQTPTHSWKGCYLTLMLQWARRVLMSV